MNNEITNVEFESLQNVSDFKVIPFDISTMIPTQYTELELSKSQKSQLGLLQSQFPNMISNSVAMNSYIVRFPEGLPHTMMQLKQGGVSTTLMGVNGKIAGTASLYSTQALSIACTGFAIMSFATGQYYLESIHSDLNLINQKIDKILGFLYGEKSSELLAEITFVNDAYKNYSSIMQNELQKLATITNLQASKKIAMKDIEFYIDDLTKTVSMQSKNYQDYEKIVSDALKIKDCLTLAKQLYTLSNILEVYYSENFDTKYVQYVKDSIDGYISKCDNRILTEFSHLNGRNSEFKSSPLKKIDTSSLEDLLSKVIDEYSSVKKSEDRRCAMESLESMNTPTEYVVTNDNRVFFKKIS